MLTTDFKKYFTGHLSTHFRGVFAFDQIPSTLKAGHFIVCNTSDSSDIGEHWFVIYRNEKVIECFDSLGIDSEKLSILQENITFKGTNKLKFNKTQVQSNTTSTCGYFCIYFIFQRFYNRDLKFAELLNEIFSVDVNKNEEIVKQFEKDLLEA